MIKDVDLHSAGKVTHSLGEIMTFVVEKQLIELTEHCLMIDCKRMLQII